MKFKGTIWMVVALVALVFYYLVIELPSEEKKKKEKARSEKILLFEPADVTEFSLVSRAQTIHLKRKGKDTWQLIEPLKAQADNEAADAFVSLLHDARFSRMVEKAPQDLSVYGLLKPGIEINLKLKGPKEMSLLVGDINPLQQKVYVKRGDDDRVFLSGTTKDDFIKTVFDLRDKSLLQFKSKDIEKVRLKNEINEFLLLHKGEAWTVSHNDLIARGDKIQIENYLHTLETSRIKDFVEETPKSLARFGLNTPSAELELHSKKTSKPLTLLAGKKRDTSGYFGKIENAPNVVLLGNQMFKILSRQFVEFMDKSLLEFKEENVTALVIENGKETIRLARKNSKDWEITEPKALRVDPSALQSVLIDLKEVRIKEFIKTVDKSPALFGLDFPSKTFTVHQKGDKTWTMKLGNASINRENFYATRTEDGTVFSLTQDSVNKLFRSLHDLRYKKLLQFNKKDIDRISIAYPKQTFELKTQSKGWTLIKPEKIENVPDFLGKDILWTLKNLEHESLVETPIDTGTSGLNEPRVTVSIWKGDNNLVGQVSVGKPLQGEENRYYAKVRDNSQIFTIKERFLDEIPKDLAKFKN